VPGKSRFGRNPTFELAIDSCDSLISPGRRTAWGLTLMVIKWDDLPKYEQQALQRVADNLSVSQDMMERLTALGLVEEAGRPGPKQGRERTLLRACR
jgi:hypothetical protein